MNKVEPTLENMGKMWIGGPLIILVLGVFIFPMAAAPTALFLAFYLKARKAPNKAFVAMLAVSVILAIVSYFAFAGVFAAYNDLNTVGGGDNSSR